MCDPDRSREWAADSLIHAVTFTKAAWTSIRNVPELSDDREKLYEISTWLKSLLEKYRRKWKVSPQNDYLHIFGDYHLMRYLGSDYWSLTLGEKDIARTLTAGIGYEEARLWADAEIAKYEAKGS